jgi:cell shape-determining protein MreC
MAKLFIGIALALMLATAALGFLAKGNIDKLQSSLKGTKGELATEQGKLRTAQSELKKTAEELATANAKVDETTKQLATKTTEAEDLTKQVAEAKLMVDKKTTEVEDLTKKLADATTVKPVGEPGANPIVTELTEKLQKAQAELAEAKQVSESIANRAKENETKLAALEQKEKRRATQLGAAGLQARILAVNSGWNFVVLSVGDKQGVTVNAPLLVVRGNEPVARLRITSVEPSTSIADVIPGSVRRGVTVQPGDTVIFEGRSSATQITPTESKPGAPALPN